METWTLSVDRRKADRAQMIAELELLAASVKDLQVDIFDEDEYWNAADSGAFRDFVPFATLSHPHRAGLEYVAEDLLERFGWLVDFRPPEK
ncbi:hypothetical protein FIV42_19975 [Persicimonas caeni]|uniref:Uncharacterized protein n=1 Tax=Persicimonas caeni TaxID=2292766 RepID=A0A4Y6PY61_PERCE|nr:hypothetical protein [Persicimonas caeni]QDG52937.1 hypothetical protein FIV42_19975 [Persicimonas caeni]QED34159.1 hypothetical protein FRD00_19970 [Persicimonas caeni]